MGHRFSNRKSLDQWSNPSNIQSDTFPVKFSSACYAIAAARTTLQRGSYTNMRPADTGGYYCPTINTTSIIIRGFTLHDEQYNSGNANQNFTGRWIAIGK